MKRTLPIFILIGIFISVQIQGQDVGGKTLVSQSRTTTANIGKCDITIKYHSPSVNGRKIFGGIVPFDFEVDGKEYPWRAGSNQRTTIEFSHPVKIEGQDLPAGEYGFLVLVNEREWTLIFSSGKSWGAFNYDPANDVLRVPVKVKKMPFQEWLSYDFIDPGSESVAVQLRWEKSAVSFNVSSNALTNILSSLEAKEDKTAADFQEWSMRTLEADPEAKEEALDLLEQSYELIDNYEREVLKKAYAFNYKILKGELLKDMGKSAEGEQLIAEALEVASGFNTYYYALNKVLVKGKSEEAYEILQQQTSRDPKNHANFLALGEFHLKQGNQKEATESFQKAYELAKGTRSENYTRYLYLQNKLVLERK